MEQYGPLTQGLNGYPPSPGAPLRLVGGSTLALLVALPRAREQSCERVLRPGPHTLAEDRRQETSEEKHVRARLSAAPGDDGEPPSGRQEDDECRGDASDDDAHQIVEQRLFVRGLLAETEDTTAE